MKTIFVITWTYSDGSGRGFVRGYEVRISAEKDLQLLKDHGDGMKHFSIVEVEVV